MVMLILYFTLIFVFIFIASKFRINPFISLFTLALLIGLLSGHKLSTSVEYITSGFANTIKNIGFVIAFGTLIGSFLEKSRATYKISKSILKITGEGRADLAVNLSGFIISIPVFCDSGFVILSPINRELSRLTKKPVALFSLSLATGLYASHVFIPPTPGPLAVISILNIDMGIAIIFGFFIGLTASIAGYLMSKYVFKIANADVSPDESYIPQESEEKFPPLFLSLLIILVPVILISLKSIAELPSKPLGDGLMVNILSVAGIPIISLFIALVLCIFLVKYTDSRIDNVMEQSLKNAGIIILITGAGGALGNVLKETNTINIVDSTLIKHNFGFLLPYLIAFLLKTAQGSSTVAMITTASILTPMMSNLGYISHIDKIFVALSISAGSMMISHVNDSYFWIITQFSNFKMENTIKSFTVCSIAQSIFSIFIIHVVYYIFK